MKNSNPIVVNGFGRGGTNILMNLLLSHPDTAMPSGELNKVFKGGGLNDSYLRCLYKQLVYDLPIRLTYGDIFNRFSYTQRPRLSGFFKNFVDNVLFIEKTKADHEGHNKFKKEFVEYNVNELKCSRLVVKAHNGLVFLNDNFRSMYSDVKFVAITRNGYAVCESLMRRGWTLEDASELYTKVGTEIYNNVHSADFFVIKFEDILENPLKSLSRIYNHLNLSLDEVEKIRLQHKRVALPDSKESHLNADYDRQLMWYDKNELEKYFKKNVNQNQIQRLNKEQKLKFTRIAGKTLCDLGYIE